MSGRFKMVKLGERRIENDQTGYKVATSVGGLSTGERGDRVILDDPHNVIKAESELERGDEGHPVSPSGVVVSNAVGASAPRS